jgi:phosphotransferase system enzyme I (PtsI)
MTFAVKGLAVTKGIAIGRAVLIGSSHMDVAHYFIEPSQVEAEIDRVAKARDVVADELRRLQKNIANAPRKDTPPELIAVLDVHLMLLEDIMLADGVKTLITDRLYNAEWALITQLEVVVRQFDEMEDEYLRERKADLEQVVDRILRVMLGQVPVLANKDDLPEHINAHETPVLRPGHDDPLVLVAHDLSPADMLQFKQSVFKGFVTDVGGQTSHTAIVARSMGIPAVVGARSASTIIRQDDWVVIDGDGGVVVVNPSTMLLEEYGFQQRERELEQSRLTRLRFTPCMTVDGLHIQLLANIEQPADTEQALKVGAVGVGLFRSEFLFMGRHSKGLSPLPDEEEQFKAYKSAVEGMKGLPVTIRTVDIGADKPLERTVKDDANLNPALGLRAIRWSLSEPTMFLTQLRAILRASVFGKVKILIPMLCSASEIKQTLALIQKAKSQLDARGQAYGMVTIGAMIEVPAAALTLPLFLKHFDFLSIGTNDLIQYTLAIDRADEAVSHLYDPVHPAILQLIANAIREGARLGKEVSLCGEMAGDVALTRLLLGLGLTSFSMHPAQILSVKKEILRSDRGQLQELAQQVLESENPHEALALLK